MVPCESSFEHCLIFSVRCCYLHRKAMCNKTCSVRIDFCQQKKKQRFVAKEWITEFWSWKWVVKCILNILFLPNCPTIYQMENPPTIYQIIIVHWFFITRNRIVKNYYFQSCRSSFMFVLYNWNVKSPLASHGLVIDFSNSHFHPMFNFHVNQSSTN